MNFLIVAMALGTISMAIVFIAGITSGVVRISTLAFRTVFAFCFVSAAVYFLMMLFDYYQEYQARKLKKLAEEVSTDTSTVKATTDASKTSEQPATGFQPMDTNNLPNIGK